MNTREDIQEPGCRYIDGKRAANEKNEGGTGGRKSITRKLPPLSMEYFVFRMTVWAHFDPTRRGRLRPEKFEEQLSAPPPAASESVNWWHTSEVYAEGQNMGEISVDISRKIFDTFARVASYSRGRPCSEGTIFYVVHAFVKLIVPQLSSLHVTRTIHKYTKIGPSTAYRVACCPMPSRVHVLRWCGSRSSCECDICIVDIVQYMLTSRHR